VGNALQAQANAIECHSSQASEGWEIMNRLAFVLVLSSAVVCVTWAALPSRAAAFDVDSQSATNSDGTARFVDPDDQPMPGLLQVAPDVQDYQGAATNPQLTPDQPGWIFSIAPKR
jgi:hypothetical protein